MWFVSGDLVLLSAAKLFVPVLDDGGCRGRKRRVTGIPTTTSYRKARATQTRLRNLVVGYLRAG